MLAAAIYRCFFLVFLGALLGDDMSLMGRLRLGLAFGYAVTGKILCLGFGWILGSRGIVLLNISW